MGPWLYIVSLDFRAEAWLELVIRASADERAWRERRLPGLNLKQGHSNISRLEGWGGPTRGDGRTGLGVEGRSSDI